MPISSLSTTQRERYGRYPEALSSEEIVIAQALDKFTPEKWKILRDESTKTKEHPWHQQIWWNNKYYRDDGRSVLGDGYQIKQPEKGEPEAPYSRKLFHPSPDSRFSLGAEGTVAYFSNGLEFQSPSL